jgi:preprotein translocase subunit YajC
VQLRSRVEKLRQSRKRSVMGVAELAGLAGSVILLLIVIFTYFYFYKAAEARLARAQIERNELQRQLNTLQEGVKLNTSTEATVSEINASLQRFEEEHLQGSSEGRLILYNVLNRLIRSNNLLNTAGPTYTYLEAGAGQAAASRVGSAKWQSLYPGIGVSVTVEGQYANLRHFVRDIEASEQFIVINAVELEKATEADNSGAAPGGGARSTLVSLRLDLAAYFRRAESVQADGPVNETR